MIKEWVLVAKVEGLLVLRKKFHPTKDHLKNLLDQREDVHQVILIYGHMDRKQGVNVVVKLSPQVLVELIGALKALELCLLYFLNPVSVLIKYYF